MKYRVRIEMTKGALRECVSYVVGASCQAVARARAMQMAVQHYPEFDGFEAYGVEELHKEKTPSVS